MFRYIYWVFSLGAYLLALPIILIKQRNPRYKERIPATYFLQNNPPLPQDKVWFHGNSLGEIKGLNAIIEAFDTKDMVITAVTNTGKEQASQTMCESRYLPYEIFLPFWVKRQKILIVTEAELKYMLFWSARHKGTEHIMMVNARVNERRYKRYKKFAWYYRRVFALIDKVYAQSEADKIRLETLGAENIEVIGNIKLSNLPRKTKSLPKPDDFMIVAASTHHEDVYEEQLILNAWDRSMGILVMVPRHPERFDEVDGLIREYLQLAPELHYHRYSEQADFKSDIVLVDQMGELINIYAVSDMVILGGAFCTSVGGHNPIEPSFFGNIVISGTAMYQQRALFAHCKGCHLIDKEALREYLIMAKEGKLVRVKLEKIGNISSITAEIRSILR